VIKLLPNTNIMYLSLPFLFPLDQNQQNPQRKSKKKLKKPNKNQTKHDPIKQSLCFNRHGNKLLQNANNPDRQNRKIPYY